jgi:hypothetical protein
MFNLDVTLGGVLGIWNRMASFVGLKAATKKIQVVRVALTGEQCVDIAQPGEIKTPGMLIGLTVPGHVIAALKSLPLSSPSATSVVSLAGKFASTRESPGSLTQGAKFGDYAPSPELSDDEIDEIPSISSNRDAAIETKGPHVENVTQVDVNILRNITKQQGMRGYFGKASSSETPFPLNSNLDPAFVPLHRENDAVAPTVDLISTAKSGFGQTRKNAAVENVPNEAKQPIKKKLKTTTMSMFFSKNTAQDSSS